MPRLSIIIPLRFHHEDFEATLVSVLENRPDDCEVIVAHDGSYPDPFNLQDEVCFAIGQDNSLINLVHAATQIATSPIVHVLADGFHATPNWTDSVEEAFQDACVTCVTPLICDIDDPSLILAAGWTNNPTRLRRPIAQGATAVGRLEARRIDGAFLAASFWRVGVLRKCLGAISIDTAIGFEAVCSHWFQQSDRQFHIATESRVTTYDDSIDLGTSGYQAGFQMQCAATVLHGRPMVGRMLLSCITQPHRFGAWTAALGRISAAIWGSKFRDQIRQDLHAIELATGVIAQDSAKILAFPSVQPLRRAA